MKKLLTSTVAASALALMLSFGSAAKAEDIKNGGEITITAKPIDATWIEIRIRDNGPGIPPELSENLFQPFATFGKSKGTGLGLYIAKEIITEHGGTIELDPTPPGACFVIRLRQET